MTEKEAIYILRNASWLGPDADRQKVEEAVEILKRNNRIELLPSGKDTNVPSKDTIYRQDVIELVKNSYYNLAESIEDTWAMVADVERLPSVETFEIGKTYPLDGYEIEIKKGECGNSFVTIKRPTKNVWRKNE